jgi:hypothetical protein
MGLHPEGLEGLVARLAVVPPRYLENSGLHTGTGSLALALGLWSVCGALPTVLHQSFETHRCEYFLL